MNPRHADLLTTIRSICAGVHAVSPQSQMLDQLHADNLEYHTQQVMQQYDLSREDAQTFIQDQKEQAEQEWREANQAVSEDLEFVARHDR
jgi:hypothetical protein